MKDARAIGEQRESPFGWERAFSHRRTTRPGQNLEVVPGRLGLPGDFVGLTCLTSRSTSARFVPYAVCSHARLSSKSGEPPRSCDPWRRHVDAALAEHIFGRGRARGRAGASAGTAVRANGYVVSVPRWIQPSEEGVEIGALATGEGGITDDVSARHAHIWCDAQNIWHVEDLSSTNGTMVVNGATNVCIQVEPGRSAQLNPGDELRLGESTTYAILLGVGASSRQMGTFLLCRHSGTLHGAPGPIARGRSVHFGPWRSPEVNLYRPPIFVEITLGGGVQ